MIDEKIKEICERRNITSFWEIFDYMKLASYEEYEALLVASELCHGDIWSQVVNAARGKMDDTGFNNMVFASGVTYSNTYASGATNINYHIMGVDPDVSVDSENVLVDIFLISDKGKKAFLPIYKAYVQTRKYELIPKLEGHIKKLTINLTTELLIKIFKDGYTNFK